MVALLFLMSANVSAQDGNAIKVDVLSKTNLSWDGRALPDYEKGKPEITVLKFKIPPGAILPLHRHPVINVAFLLSGELTVMTEEQKTLHPKAGEAFVEVVNTWHYGKNEGSVPAELVVIYAGTPGVPVTVNKPGAGSDH